MLTTKERIREGPATLRLFTPWASHRSAGSSRESCRSLCASDVRPFGGRIGGREGVPYRHLGGDAPFALITIFPMGVDLSSFTVRNFACSR